MASPILHTLVRSAHSLEPLLCDVPWTHDKTRY